MNQLKDIITIIITSALPIVEQKVAIPLGISLGISEIETYLYTLLGAMIPSPFILLFIPRVFEFMKRFDKLGDRVRWYEKRAMKKGGNIVKYELLGLLMFVAIPLPGTGVWTGSTVAAMLGLDFKKSLMTVFIGAAICGLLILLAYKGIASFIFWL